MAGAAAAALGPMRTFACVSAFQGALHNVGRGFGPAADSLSLRVQRKEAKKAPSIRHTFRAVVIDRCAPAGAALDLAKPRSTDWPGQTVAALCTVMLSRGKAVRAGLRRRNARRGVAGQGGLFGLPAPGLPLHGVRQQVGAGVARRLPGQSVERGFARSSAAAAGAQRSITTALKVCRIEGAFFASSLCTSKERESAAGPKPRPTLRNAPRKAETAQQDVANVRNGPKAARRQCATQGGRPAASAPPKAASG